MRKLGFIVSRVKPNQEKKMQECSNSSVTQKQPDGRFEKSHKQPEVTQICFFTLTHTTQISFESFSLILDQIRSTAV